jgi:antitoxin (DNA-binding transcriptional repressor) of toxin-antitoxin stability system
MKVFSAQMNHAPHTNWIQNYALFHTSPTIFASGVIQHMSTFRITEAELARDVHGVLEKVQQGIDVVVEQNDRPVAVIKAPHLPGRKISEVITALESSGAKAVVDEDFARDVEEGIQTYRTPWNPPFVD